MRSRISFEAGRKGGAVALDLLTVPTAADTKQKPAARHLVDRGDELCRLDRVALHDQAHPGRELQGLCDDRRSAQHDKRVHDLVIGLGQFAATRKWGLARHRDVRMLRRPHRLEPARLERPSELDRRDRVVGMKHRHAKMHIPSPSLLLISDPKLPTGAGFWKPPPFPPPRAGED